MEYYLKTHRQKDNNSRKGAKITPQILMCVQWLNNQHTTHTAHECKSISIQHK